MTGDIPEELKQHLVRCGQQHVLRWWNELGPLQRIRLVEQLKEINLDQLRVLAESARSGNHAAEKDALIERANRAVSPASLVRLPKSAEEHARWDQARQTGESLLKDGKVGALLVAGGQGSRLGFEKPKGMFPIGPVSGATLFQILAEQLLARSRRAGRSVPYFIMTSDATHDPTVAFFAQHANFGLPPGDVFFFKQGKMPAVDATTGRLLLAGKGTINTSPDGHGGMLSALAKAGLIDVMEKRGIELLHYHQVDNPTAIVCDPVFLGFHYQQKSEASTKVVAKRSAQERMGVVVELDGHAQIIEYSDLPAEIASKTDERGNLKLWAGNTAIHVFSRSFLRRLSQNDSHLPFHIARKKVPYCDESGKEVVPQKENSLKFERFLFDALPLADRTLVLETDRQREFNPVKNASGDDSPETAQTALLNLHRHWLIDAGVAVDKSTPVEISPLYALDADDVRAKRSSIGPITAPTWLGP